MIVLYSEEKIVAAKICTKLFQSFLEYCGGFKYSPGLSTYSFHARRCIQYVCMT